MWASYINEIRWSFVILLWPFIHCNCLAGPAGESAPPSAESMRLFHAQNQKMLDAPGQIINNLPEPSSYLTEDPDLQARVNAFQNKLVLRGRLEMGAITKEEYDHRTAPLEDIIQYPGIMTNQVNPEQVMIPDIGEQVDAFQKSIILQRQYQRGLITSEEFSRQSDVLEDIIQRPVQWMTVE